MTWRGKIDYIQLLIIHSSFNSFIKTDLFTNFTFPFKRCIADFTINKQEKDKRLWLENCIGVRKIWNTFTEIADVGGFRLFTNILFCVHINNSQANNLL